MKRWVVRGVRTVVVLFGVILLASFTIDATETLNDSQSALSFFAKQIADTTCPTNMTEVQLAGRSICVDVYENSFHEDCPIASPRSTIDTQQNINALDCRTESVAAVVPAVYVSFHQAQNFCARRGARLPNAEEWYEAALATPDNEACNLQSNLDITGAFDTCRSARGAYDMVGNAWEWVDTQVNQGTYDGRPLPQTGYVSEADRSGVAINTSGTPNALFNQDYFWSTDEGVRVMMRGGYFNSGSDGGLFSIHTDIEPSFTSAAIGFRCVLDS